MSGEHYINKGTRKYWVNVSGHSVVKYVEVYDIILPGQVNPRLFGRAAEELFGDSPQALLRRRIPSSIQRESSPKKRVLSCFDGINTGIELSVQEISAQTGLPEKAVKRHVDALRGKGLMRIEREGSFTYSRVKE